MKKYLLVWTLLLTSTFRLFSAEYKLNLHSEQWKITQKGYFLSEIRDGRNDKTTGNVMDNGKIVSADFPTSITEDLYTIVKNSLSFDTSSVPVILEIEKFKLIVKGNAAKHQEALDFSIRFYREIDGEIFELFKLSGRPQMNVQGNMKDIAEKNIMGVLKQTFESFDDWMKKNLNIPIMSQSVEVAFLPSANFKSDRGDTLIWDESYRLQWTDFKGKTPNSDFAAESNCMFNYIAREEVSNGKMTLFVNFDACFIKASSWVREGKELDSLLLHEQLHFNICEVHARKFKTKLKSLVLNPIHLATQVKEVFDEEWKAYVQTQADYDEQTQHGLIRDQQMMWQKKVDELLGRVE